MDAKTLARFWAKVAVGTNDECWEWLASRLVGGYGQLRCRVNGKRLMPHAHRLSWEIHNGQIPDGLFVLHHCDNPPCVNPAHLFLGTHADNMADKFKKGRTSIGILHGHARLTDDKVRDIRNDSASGMTYLALGRKYNISPAHAWRIVQRWAWSHI